MKATVQQIKDFICKYGPKNDHPWTEGRIMWYLQHDLYKLVSNESGQLIGLAFARPLNCEKVAFAKPYVYEDGGSICYVDLAVSIDSRTRRKLVDAAFNKKFRNCTRIAFQRSKQLGKIKVYLSKLIKERFK